MEPAPTFGPRLRQERERRQISLTSIAANTKISRSLLEALERDDVSRWPSGIFRRSFVRSYAQAIGLAPDEVLREFMERFPDPAATPAAGQPAAAPQALTHRSSPDRIEIVLRISLPRSWASWVAKLTALAGFVPRGQNQNT
jgi:cytoskeletal protein RodZ